MIELRHVSSGYGSRPVLKDISLSFPKGSVTVLLGPNGCGKSTLLKTALGLLPHSDGEILYHGRELRQLSAREIARQAAYLSQNRPVPHITVGRMVLHGRFPYLDYPRHYRPEDYEIVREALRRTDSLELLNRRMEELSGGQRQKVYLAMALAQQTDAVFMDEPTTYLDIRHQLEVMALARSLAGDGAAVVLVLHDLDLALRTADQIAILCEGRLLAADPPERIYLSGILQEVFGVRVCRSKAGNSWQYSCELPHFETEG